MSGLPLLLGLLLDLLMTNQPLSQVWITRVLHLTLLILSLIQATLAQSVEEERLHDKLIVGHKGIAGLLITCSATTEEVAMIELVT